MLAKFSILKKRSTPIIILFLAVMTLAVYWPVQNYEFINYDDQIYVTNNFRIQNGITVESIKDTFNDFHLGNWHPLTMISHMLDWQLFGNKAGGHHWTSVIIHILNAVLLFLFLRIATGAIWRSAFVAALFALHPINVESVAWIAERKNVLSTFFWILTMILYVWYVKSPGWKRYLPIVFSFALGLMSKAMLVTLPFVLLLLDYWPLKRTSIETRDENKMETSSIAVKKQTPLFLIIEKIPLFVLSAIFIYVTLYAQKAANAMASLTSVPLLYRLGNAIISYGLYIKKMIWPFDLAVFYPFNYNMSLWHVILVALLIIAITIFVCIYFRRLPYLPMGWFWYLGTLVPVIGLVQVGSQAMADRYAYVPFIGLFIMLTWGAVNIFKKRLLLKIITMFSVLILSVLIVIAHFQINHWKDTYTIFNHTLNVTRNNAFTHSVLAGELLTRNKAKEAMIHAQAAFAFDPKYYDNLIRLAWAYNVLGEKNKAIEILRKAIEINPKELTAYNVIYKVYMQMGKKKEGLNEYRKAIKFNIDNPKVYNKFGDILTSQSLYDEAARQYNEALRVRPDDILANYGLGKVLMEKGETDAALKQFQKVIEIQPRYAAAHYQLAIILKKRGMIEESSRYYQKAMRIIQSQEGIE